MAPGTVSLRLVCLGRALWCREYWPKDSKGARARKGAPRASLLSMIGPLWVHVHIIATLNSSYYLCVLSLFKL